jgi:hypothetical protein
VINGERFSAAATPEAVIGVVLAVAAVIIAAGAPRARQAAYGVIGFAILGVIVGVIVGLTVLPVRGPGPAPPPTWRTTLRSWPRFSAPWPLYCEEAGVAAVAPPGYERVKWPARGC